LIDMTGQIAIVTGGTRGLGRAITEGLLAAGFEVAICGRNAPDALPEAGGRTAWFSACDVRDATQVRAFVDALAQRYGRIDLVVNNAGGTPLADSATASPRFSESIIALNLLAPLHVAQAANRYMQNQSEGGSIINIASISGLRPAPGTAVYGAAKAGLLSLTQGLAQEWGPKVRVNAIIVGLVKTENAGETYGSDAAQEAIAASLPLKRMATGEDIARAVLLLASPLAAYISGAQLRVDGGGEKPLFLELVKAGGEINISGDRA